MNTPNRRPTILTTVPPPPKIARLGAGLYIHIAARPRPRPATPPPIVPDRIIILTNEGTP